MDFSSRYAKLNTAQKQAVDTIDGPVMVIAGPGTGKTELLGMRAANILKSTDTLPENILCLTFTESGANAMRQRLTEIIGPSAYKVAIHTFHSFGTEVINQNGEFFYHGANFRPADELSSHELLRQIFDELDYSSPIASKMNGEYTYLRDTLSAISELKKSGLTSDELLTVLDAGDRVIDLAEPLLKEVFMGRISKTTLVQLEPIVTRIRAIDGETGLPGVASLSQVLADSLEAAVNDASAENSTKLITKWKNTWIKKDETGNLVLKSRDRHTKLRAVSYIYFQYLARMQEAELYDFDDMILRVVHAMEVFPELRFNLQEKYQYIMVDEFQDTNLAQMRILYNLTSSESSGDRPNIMVVGDDDQAIYSFQGADVGNIHSFRDLYNQTKLVVLTDNYRSTETILSHAREVITRGEDRLENRIDELNKTLTSHKSNANTMVKLVELPSADSERAWLARDIAASIKSGTPPASIALLARRHHEIQALLPYLAEEGVRVNYERRDNVLNQEVVMLVEQLAKILVALNEGQHDIANSLIPELLAHPTFTIDPLSIWKLSLQATKNRQYWMEVMAVTPEFIPLHAWLIVNSQALTHTPLEQMLDEMIGVPKQESADEKPFSPTFVSPIYEYYFSPEKLAEIPDSYLTYLEALRTIRTKLREYKPTETPTLKTFVEFVRLHRELGSTITNIRPHVDHIEDAINVMTAHKSKGLEFDHVYVIGAVDTAWGERARGRGRLIGYPENLPLAPSGDTPDERLRLFFVAMTRAKRQLTITYAQTDDVGKETFAASFLTGDQWTVERPEVDSTVQALTNAAMVMWHQPLVKPLKRPMRDLLTPMLENYKLSSTHLNSFLDITRGGPHYFLINNLLRFPQTPSPNAGFGIAIHAALQRAHVHLAATNNQRPIEDIMHDFEEALKAQNLRPDDFQPYLQKGIDCLTTFLEAKYDEFSPHQKAELNFADQSVYLGGAHLTGLLDLVDIQDGIITVTDYKTGRATRNWQGRTDYEKVKLHKYKQQLMFYNLLITHSRDYSKYEFAKGILQFVEPTPKNEIIALEATFSQDDLNTFGQLIQKVWEHIVALNLPDTSHYEPSFKGILAFEADLLDDKI